MLERTLPPGFSVPARGIELAPAALCEASFAMTLEREIRGLRPGRTLAGGFDGDEDGLSSFCLPTILLAAAVNDMGVRAGNGLRG